MDRSIIMVRISSVEIGNKVNYPVVRNHIICTKESQGDFSPCGYLCLPTHNIQTIRLWRWLACCSCCQYSSCCLIGFSASANWKAGLACMVTSYVKTAIFYKTLSCTRIVWLKYNLFQPCIELLYHNWLFRRQIIHPTISIEICDKKTVIQLHSHCPWIIMCYQSILQNSCAKEMYTLFLSIFSSFFHFTIVCWPFEHQEQHYHWIAESSLKFG